MELDIFLPLNQLSTKLSSASKRKKNYFDKKRSQQAEDKQDLKKILRFSNSMINRLTGLQISKVTLKENTSANFESNDFLLELERDAPEEAHQLYKLMYWKEQHNISDKIYQALQDATTNLPTLYSAKNFRKKLNDTLVIHSNDKGFYAEIVPLLTNLIDDMFARNQIKLNDKILIKLAGDGTNVGVRKLLNFTFSILNSETCLAASGHHTLGVFEMRQESFEDIDICLKEIIRDLANLKQVEITNGVRFEVDLFLAGDLKFLSIAHGINGAQANYPCIWCTVSKHQYRSHIDKCSIIDESLKARKHSQFETLGHHSGEQSTSFTQPLVCRIQFFILKPSGYLRKSIFDFIPFEKTIPDMLHMFMRIAERLLKLLVEATNTTDQILAAGTNTHSLFLRLANRIQEITHLTKNVFFVEKDTYRLVDFSGDRLHLIFQSLELQNLLPEVDKIRETEMVSMKFVAEKWYIEHHLA